MIEFLNDVSQILMRNKLLRMVLVLLCISAPSLFGAEEAAVSIKSGFLTGNSFRQLSHSEKRGYAIGFLEGVFMAPMFDAPKLELRWIESCAIGMTDNQVVAIIMKFLDQNPQRWHDQMNILAWVALKEACNHK
jgi:hypothetical protein